MISKQLMKKLIVTEGIRLVPYKDSKGNLTVGVGHRVTHGDGSNRQHSANQVKDMFLRDIVKHQKEARRFIGAETWDKLSTNRQDALTEMAFNVGIHKFPKMKEAIVSGNFDQAVNEMLDSKWYREDNIPGRVMGIVQAFQGDTEPKHFSNTGDTLDIEHEFKATVNAQKVKDASTLLNQGKSLNKLEDIRDGLSPKKIAKKPDKAFRQSQEPFHISDERINKILGRPNSKNLKAIKKDLDLDRDLTKSRVSQQTTGIQQASITGETKEEREARTEKEATTLYEGQKFKKNIEAQGLSIKRDNKVNTPGGMFIPSDTQEIQRNLGITDFSKFKNRDRNI